MLMFARAISTAQEIYGRFDQQFAEGMLLSWAMSHLDHKKAECLDITNHYFTLKRNAGGLSSISFQEEVDPYAYGVLVNMAAGDWFIPMFLFLWSHRQQSSPVLYNIERGWWGKKVSVTLPCTAM